MHTSEHANLIVSRGELMEHANLIVSQEELTEHANLRPIYSIVAPVYNEREILPEFYLRTVEAMTKLNEPFEIVFVNDGSRDGSTDVLRELHQKDQRVKVINLSRNFGHQLAITAGIDYAMGDAVIIIDSDLQDPPEFIIDLIVQWRSGYEVIYATRQERVGESIFKKMTAALFYRLIRRITNVNLPVDTGDFRLMDRRVVNALKSMREHNRFMRGLSAWTGYRQIGLPYRRDARKAGTTKYPFWKMVRFALDAITSFSYMPLQLATYFGFALALLSVIGILTAIILRVTGLYALQGQATTLVSVLFLGGVQLIFLGIIGEYLGRIYDEVKQRPLYLVAEELTGN
jgi:polyisoprenyl-phosphate glycosyltransferase